LALAPPAAALAAGIHPDRNGSRPFHAHLALYVILIVMPIAGYLNAAAAGHTVSLFGVLRVPPCLPENGRLSQAAIAAHLVGQYVLYLFVALHIARALHHGVIRRDGILDRMLPARRYR